ncbi:autotransporter assembly complex protein TamA [Thalassovita taeanensis]|uniref:autotransporter assembly complex protein TamA n=1 Tax=Thalassovita taeanensis TaxID=657014 RepID=UPI001FE662D3|nr:autotransporter assembly complex family protein [Thalassovita taeanensis]
MAQRSGILHIFKALAVVALGVSALPAHALDSLDITLRNSDNTSLRTRLRLASLLRTADKEGVTDPQDLFATALADYQRLLETLYAYGYYSGVINIRLDGQEAALIPPLSPPKQISRIDVSIDPGPPFVFATARIAPLAPGTTLPPEFARGQRARSSVVLDSVQTAVTGWREAGYAKATPGARTLTADHAARTLSAQIAILPGPQVRFGRLIPAGTSAVRARRIHRIAGLPEGEVFSPQEIDKAATRLRRTGTFRSVDVTEAKTLGPDNTMDITAAVVDEKRHRFGAGAEISNVEGLALSGFWMHRNLLGGAERLRVEGSASGIGGTTGGIDYALGTRFERPAVFGADTKFFAHLDLEVLDEPDFKSNEATAGVGATRIFSDHLEGDLEIALTYSETEDAFGKRRFTLLTFPTALRWDLRDNILNPTRGHYINANVTPFFGLSGEDTGGQIKFDSRIYRSLGSNDRFVVAGRVQLGSVVGPALADAPPTYLFHSGGGGTVRGQPYQSLGVDLGGGTTAGGRSFVGLSGELRARMTDTISLVGFADAGYIGAESFYDGSGEWHSGAGLGLRYDTVVGPVRLDIAAPLSGSTGEGVQVYVGIGQAF